MNLTMDIHLKYAAQLSRKWGPPLSTSEQDTGAGSKLSTHTITPALSYLLMENFRAGLYVTIDLNDEDDHTKANTYQINLRTML